MSEVETLLRQALEERRAKPIQAVTDLKSIIKEIADAVSSVTQDKVRVVLEPLGSKKGRGPAYVILLRTGDDERALRVIEFSEMGYPARIFNDISNWENSLITSNADGKVRLQHLLKDLYSGPQSEIVRFVDNLLAVTQDESGLLASGETK